MKILNLTQHPATLDQIDQGVFDLPQGAGSAGEYAKSVLTFLSIPSSGRLFNAANDLANLTVDFGYSHAMIGGAPFFMSKLEEALLRKGVKPLYAFSERISEETVAEDGTVIKINVFKHVGFVDPTTGMEFGL